MKSIRFFIESLDGGGAEHILETLVAYIDRSKYKIQVVSQEECPNSSIKHKFFFKRNLNKNKLLEFINKVIIKFSLVAPEKIVKKIFLPGKFDIEVAFCEGYATKLIGYSSTKKRTKKIAWVHTDVLNNPWSEEVFGGPQKEKECYERFDYIICVSETMRENFIKKYGMDKKVQVIYNIIDYDHIKNQSTENVDFSPKDNTVNFIMVGRIVKIKGYDRIIRIADDLKNQGYKFTITILGRGVGMEAFKYEIKTKCLQNNIFLLGYQTNPYKYIAASDALICASYAEGYSTTVTEAIVLGKPVITTECSGMKEIFGNKECGIICENTEESLYNTIKSVLDKPQKLEVFSDNSKERAKDFSVQKRVNELDAFLRNI